jgi:mono/diheme cytochrome c family protein
MKLRLKNLPLIVTLTVVAGPVGAISSSFAAAQGSQDSGAGVYKAKCATCHGQDGSGNTPVGKSLKVADLRSAEVQKKTDAELAQSVVEGKGNMPSFKSSTTEDEIHAVVMYVRSLAPKAGSDPKKHSGN